MHGILLFETIDYDLGCDNNWYNNSKIELYGSWDNWQKGIKCTFGVINGVFKLFTIFELKYGKYEYKYKYTQQTYERHYSVWFGDKSEREKVGPNGNQILIFDQCVSEKINIEEIFNLINYKFDKFIEHYTFYDIINFILKLRRDKFLKPTFKEDDICIICCELLSKNKSRYSCLNKHIIHNVCLKELENYDDRCPLCRESILTYDLII
jgi:hypothetical protein